MPYVVMAWGLVLWLIAPVLPFPGLSEATSSASGVPAAPDAQRWPAMERGVPDPPRTEARRISGDTVTGTPYYRISLRRPGDPRGRALGHVAVAFVESPFNVAVTSQGYYGYDLHVLLERLPVQAGAVPVLWVASPDLEYVEKVGMAQQGLILRSRVDFHNQFLVFVTEEMSEAVEAPQGRILAQGVSRSGRLESMFSHGFCPPDVQC